jgi:regulator of protease activity HflC (stomatin/prohibitin superfamily)
MLGRVLRRRLATEHPGNMPWLFFLAACAIPAFYAVGLIARTGDNFTTTEFWRFWVVHLWVEDFLELFTTVMVAYMFVLLGVVREKVALTVIFLDTVTLTVPPQEVITRDNVPARVAAVCYFRVVDPSAAVTEIEAFGPATSQIAQTTLRSVLGGADLDQLLGEREQLNERLGQIVDEQTAPWGIKVTAVEIKDVEIPEVMQRAMARQAEAERERRAKIINAEGEFQAAEKLAAAAAIIDRQPSALQLRYLQTLLEIGADQSSTIVFPLPLDLIAPFLAGPARERNGTADRAVR